MKQYEVKTVTIPRGETLAYREAGSGPVAVLVHGNMSSSVHWQTTMQALEKDFHVYAPDLRGFGDSTYNQTFNSLHELALDIEEFVDAMGIDKFALAGWSTGGGIVLEIAADLPGRVTKAVLLDSVPPTGYPMFKKDENGQPILTQLLTTKEEIASDPIQVLPALNAYASGDRATMRAIWDAVIYNLNQPPAEDYEEYLTAIMKQRNLVDIDYSLLTFNMTDAPTGSAPGSGHLAKIHCPVVILHGEKDLVVPLAWGQQTADLLGDKATMITFPSAGHSAITDEPDLFFKTLAQSLA